MFAGGSAKSHCVGSQSLQELAEWELNATRVSELTVQAGRELKTQQTTMVEEHHRREANRRLTAPREVSPEAPENLPQVGVVEMDGGRIRTRNEHGPRGVTNPHWREFQAGCVVRLQSEESAEDPRPEVPRLFLDRPKVQKLVTQLHRQKAATSEDTTSRDTTSEDTPGEQSIGEILAEEGLAENASDQPSSTTSNDSTRPKRPVRLQRTCVATLQGADACGRILAAEAATRGLDHAPRKGFLGDGQAAIWAVWALYFASRGYVPILDFIHLLSYVYGIAMVVGSNADDGWQRYVTWITALWKGQAKQVLAEWRILGQELDVYGPRAGP